MKPLLEVRNLSVRYATDGAAVTAVRDVSFELAPGRAIGVVGESGSGKSTIAGAILDLLHGDVEINGEILLESMDLSRLNSKQRRKLLGRRIGTVFQDPFTALNPAMTVGRHIAEPLIYHLGFSAKAALDRACDLLADMGVPRVRDVTAAYPHQLSGGMRQRALLAAALACEPSLLILDEPTTALDVTVEAQILALLADLRRHKDVSLLFISHSLGVVHEVCDDLVVLYASQAVEQGPAGEVLARPKHPYTKGLLASLPRLVASGRGSRLPSIPGRMANVAQPPQGCFFEARCPYAEPRCKTEEQALLDIASQRRARCWKAADVGDWPVAAKGAAVAPRLSRRDALVNVVDLRKTFRTSSGLDVIRIDFSGQGPALSYRPKSVNAVDGISLSVSPGEVLGLVGESGCGKSTLGRAILRLLRASAGSVEFDGVPILHQPEKALLDFRRSAQIIFQNADSSLNPRLSVGEAIERPLALFNLAHPADRRRRMEALLDMVRLPRSYQTRYPHQLSGGEKQRVAIARALATEPKFVVCDEPVSALDVSVQAVIVNLLADLRDEFNLAYLFISHDLAVVAQISDRIAVMYRGGLCEIGVTAEILRRPRHPYTQSLLSSSSVIDSEKANRNGRLRLFGSIEAEDEQTSGCRYQARCPYKVGTICETLAPPLRQISQGHSAACHLESIPANEVTPSYDCTNSRS
jgi:peptide/nickel transport system ATP-binding protein